MNILALKTDNPTAELYLYKSTERLDEMVWAAHKELSSTLHEVIDNILENNGLSFDSVEGLVLFRGPGSFTGLRIGATVFNTLADALSIPVVGTSGDNWALDGVELILNGSTDSVVLPEYGQLPNITKPKK